MTRKIDKIIIHCSDSPFGDMAVIDVWHKDRGWRCIGYHRVVLNGFPKTTKKYESSMDGRVEWGRPETEDGAHCYGHNDDSIGICLIGVNDFTPKQFESLKRVVKEFMDRYEIPMEGVFGHRDFDLNKTCPNFDVGEWMKGWAV